MYTQMKPLSTLLGSTRATNSVTLGSTNASPFASNTSQSHSLLALLRTCIYTRISTTRQSCSQF